ncbi:tetratricopeptide repeat protein [Nannocystis sp. ILAH1]|uniref:tetratricopeptide repeat protein n=1 Tax=Nannocystis sp. ILAH1 TaxID=2996789 RepID=UPI00226D9D5D|nr:tetratricopeptide repeat protein [Nannocystis sp. ILAH1]MCY0994939.1 tetratricopeptide repeat protein [Nannocystis sp. ILAH1]
MRLTPIPVVLVAALALCRCAREEPPVPGPREAVAPVEHAPHAPRASHDAHAAHDAHEPPLAALTAAAESGDVDAQVALGQRYLRGSAQVPADVGQARAWFLRAEAARPGSAAYELGRMSQSGKGVPADPVEAVRWFELAVDAGSADAMFLLAGAARTGAGLPRDDARAVALYQRAAAMEHPEALQALALAYLHGELGLKVDESESRRYMAAAGHALQHHHR